MDDIIDYFQNFNSEYSKVKMMAANRQLGEYVKRLFPIFEEIPYCNVFITFAEDTPFEFGVDYPDNCLGLYFQFRYRDRNRVIEWFENSKYQNYDFGERDWSRFFVYYRIEDLLDELD